MNRLKLKRLSAGTLLALLSACANSSTDLIQAGVVTAGSQPTNVGDAGSAALAYHDSGAYDRDVAVVATEAKAWLTSQASKVTHPALVLDIDETALSNWEIIKLDDFGRPIPGPCHIGTGAPCGWASWDQLGRDPAIEPTLDVFRSARDLGVAVFFITGRPESQRAATERNLAVAGYRGYARLYLVPNGAHFTSAADFNSWQIWVTNPPILLAVTRRRASCYPILSTECLDYDFTRSHQSNSLDYPTCSPRQLCNMSWAGPFPGRRTPAWP